MYSSTMRYTGTSGVDVESMITQLMNAERLKYDRVYRETELLKYKQEAYQGVGTKLSAIQKANFDVLSSTGTNFRKSSTWTNYTTSVKDSSGNDSSAISFSFSSSVDPKDFSVKVNSVAQGEKFTSKPSGAGKITGDGSVGTANDILDVSYNVNVNGVSKKISFTADDLTKYGLSGSDSASQLLEAKVEDTFGIDAINVDYTTGTITTNEGNTFAMSQVFSETDPPETTNLSEFGFGTDTSVNTSIRSNSTLEDVFDIPDGKTLDFSINGVNFNEFDSNTTMSEFINTINNSEANVTLAFSEISSTFTIASNGLGSNGKIDFENTVAGSGDFQSIFGDIDQIRLDYDSGLDPAGYQAAAQAEVEYTDQNGVSTTIIRNSNNFTVDGINFNVKKITTDTLDVSVNTDTDTTASNIRIFVEKYNEMLEAIYDELGTKRSKSSTYSYYEPLTSEEREAMSETEQENWDKKAKEGLLYGDSILRGIESSLRQAIIEPVTLEDGTKISLYDFGITTGKDWSEKGKLVIDEDKLAEGLEKYGDKVDELFTQNSTENSGNGVANRINSILDDAVGYSGSITEKAGLDTSLVSLTTNSMYIQIQKKESELSDIMDDLTDKENYYYTIFGNMESYITQQNAQMNYLLSSMG